MALEHILFTSQCKNQLIELLILILPAMAANGSPVVGSYIISTRLGRKLHPIDAGRKLWDGKRILGDGKTWEGFFTGTIVGVIVGLILGLLLHAIGYFVVAGLIGGAGAMIGDIIGSFIKRRIGLARGELAPILDQLDFYVVVVILLYLAGYPVSLCASIILAAVVFTLHILTNYVAILLGIKDRL